MFDAKKLLDALMSAAARPGGAGQGGGAGIGAQVGSTIQTAKDVVQQHPTLAPAALIGLAGLLFGRRRPGGLSGSLATLGGLALVGGLAYKAYRSHQTGQPLSDGGDTRGRSPDRDVRDTTAGMSAAGTSPDPDAGAAMADMSGERDVGPEIVEVEVRETFRVLDIPPTSRFHPVSQTEDDVLLYLRTMVAAAVADGQLDARERRRITEAMVEAGIDPEASRWLEREMAAPADVEELAAAATTPEKAAQVYTAARIVLDPDTVQEREFLRLLAEELDLDPNLRRRIDDAAEAVGPV
jgi:uncharacterized membrane protein YebE (DUF533 family)